jgi:hypothetical protein
VSPSATRDAVLAHVTAVLDGLSSAQLDDLAAGRGRLVFRPETGGRPRRLEPSPRTGSDVSTAVAEINQLSCPAEVAGYLQRERFTVPVLREIARALGPTVASTGRSKEDLIRDIAEGTAGYRIRSAAMSGGAWS